MKQIVTKGIVLSRTDYGEADRIVTFITPDQGKVRVMARGVRKIKSRLAGGIELFSISDITFARGRGDIGTLISTRLITHYGRIVHDINRVQQGYELIKLVNKTTEDDMDDSYYVALGATLASLDDPSISLDLTRLWLQAQLLHVGGHLPNLLTDASGEPLTAEGQYEFDFDSMAFRSAPSGPYTADHIKAMRLLFSKNLPARLATVDGMDDQLERLDPILRYMAATYLRP